MTLNQGVICKAHQRYLGLDIEFVYRVTTNRVLPISYFRINLWEWKHQLAIF